MRKIKLKYLGFIIAIFLLVSGWLIILISKLTLSDQDVHQVVDKIGTFLAGSGGLGIFGGIAFYAIISLKEDNRESGNLKIKEEYYITGAPHGIASILRVFTNGTTFALFNNYPLNDVETEKFETEFSLFIGAKAFQYDHKCFLIQSNEELVVKKAICFLETKSEEWETDIQ